MLMRSLKWVFRLHLYLKATADSHVFIRNKDIRELASKCKTPIEALDLAVGFEKGFCGPLRRDEKIGPRTLWKT